MEIYHHIIVNQAKNERIFFKSNAIDREVELSYETESYFSVNDISYSHVSSNQVNHC